MIWASPPSTSESDAEGVSYMVETWVWNKLIRPSESRVEVKQYNGNQTAVLATLGFLIGASRGFWYAFGITFYWDFTLLSCLLVFIVFRGSATLYAIMFENGNLNNK